MAFLQRGPGDEDFINIGNSVGTGKANSPNDVLVVQAVLAIVFNNDIKLKKLRPGNRPPVVSSKLEKDTPKLIAVFQRVQLKRPNPQGFCDQAPASASSQLKFSTIFNLFTNASLIQAGLTGEDVTTKLQRDHSSLSNLPRRASELVVGH
jgi:hypothetical protein